jgi:hypothetical protein
MTVFPVDSSNIICIIKSKKGAVAQSGERLVRSEKAASSTLVCSMIKYYAHT